MENMMQRKAVENQVKLQMETQAAGFNAVFCGNCNTFLLHKIGDTKIDCLCGLTMDISNCPDLWCEENIEDFVRATATNEGTGSEHNTSYNLITWPESQNFMEEEWFEDEAILALGNEDKTGGGGAYFIPTHRLKKQL